MAKPHLYRFVVEGSLSFPLDMLRYDSCYPESSDDVALIEDSFRSSKVRRVKVLKNTDGKAEGFHLWEENGRWRIKEYGEVGAEGWPVWPACDSMGDALMCVLDPVAWE